MLVYMVKYDFSSNDAQDTYIYLFFSREKAVEKFKSIVKNVYDSYWKIVAFTDGKLDEDYYTLDTNIDDIETARELYYEISESNDFYNHDFIELSEIEVQ